jgi:hypothetical protein
MNDEIFQAEYRTRMTRSISDEEMAREMFDSGRKVERERIADRLQILFEAVITGSIPITLQHCAIVTEMIAELKAESYTEGE